MLVAAFRFIQIPVYKWYIPSQAIFAILKPAAKMQALKFFFIQCHSYSLQHDLTIYHNFHIVLILKAFTQHSCIAGGEGGTNPTPERIFPFGHPLRSSFQAFIDWYSNLFPSCCRPGQGNLHPHCTVLTLSPGRSGAMLLQGQPSLPIRYVDQRQAPARTVPD